MTNSVAPFRLDEGVLLEDSGTLLPWSSSVKDLLELAGGYQKRWEEVTWSNHQVLDGLRANVRFIYRRGAFEIIPVFESEQEEVFAYKMCYEHLCNKIGVPHESRTDRSGIVKDLVYPVSIWNVGSVQICLRTSDGKGAGLIPLCDLYIQKK